MEKSNSLIGIPIGYFSSWILRDYEFGILNFFASHVSPAWDINEMKKIQTALEEY